MAVHSVSYWEDRWQEKRQKSHNQTMTERIGHWDGRAEEFAAAVTGDRGRRRCEEILGWLQAQGVSLTDTHVLDVGAGPGAFTVALAKRVRQVTALEPSQEMLHYLAQSLKEKGISNVKTLRATWEEVDLDKHGLRDGHELVFASMCPGISSYAMIEKAFAASKTWCYISTYVRHRYYRVLDQLLPILGLQIPSLQGNMLYIMNLVYTSGFDFTSRVWEETWRQTLPLHDASAKLCGAIAAWFPSADVAPRDVEAAIAPAAREGLYTLETTARLGALLAKRKP